MQSANSNKNKIASNKGKHNLKQAKPDQNYDVSSFTGGEDVRIIIESDERCFIRSIN